MSLAETGALDDEMLTTKNIIANVISPIEDSSADTLKENVIDILEVTMDDADTSTIENPQKLYTTKTDIDTSIHNPLNNNNALTNINTNTINSSADLNLKANNNRADLRHTINQKRDLRPNLKNKQQCYARIRYDHIPGNDRFSRVTHVTQFFEYELGYEDTITFQCPTNNVAYLVIEFNNFICLSNSITSYNANHTNHFEICQAIQDLNEIGR